MFCDSQNCVCDNINWENKGRRYMDEYVMCWEVKYSHLICDPQTDHVRPKNVTHLQRRRRTWRILSARFNRKETSYLLKQAYSPNL